MPNMKLQSSDGEIFEVDVEIVKMFFMMREMEMDAGEQEVVRLPRVDSAILNKIIQWATYHKDDPPLPEDDEDREKRTDDISSWDEDFLRVDNSTLFELTAAANYLDIKSLLDVCCKVIAKKLFIGKTPEEIRKSILLPEESQQVRQEDEGV